MIKSDLGAVTAYADAVAHGYTGTREDFGKLLAGAGKNLEDAVDASNAAEAAAENAENAAQAAADAAGAARQAAGVAGSAAKASRTSAGEAAQSAEAAEIAKQRAEDAAKKALEAKTGSENALQDADAAKDAASGYADAAAERATAAAASEKNAARSANSAADSATAAKKSADDADNTANSIKDSMTQISENKEAVSRLKEDIKNIHQSSSLVDFENINWIEDTYIDNNTGEEVSYAKWVATDYIELPPQKLACVHLNDDGVFSGFLGRVYYAWYDSNKKYLTGANTNSILHYFDKNAKYIRLSFVKAQTVHVILNTEAVIDALREKDVSYFVPYGKIKIFNEETITNLQSSVSELRDDVTKLQSSAYILPDSWIEKGKELRLKKKNNFVFGIQTDTHFSCVTDDITVGNNIKELTKSVGVDFIANLGDIIRGYATENVDDVEHTRESYTELMKRYVDGVCCPFLFTMGNHDMGNMWANAKEDTSLVIPRSEVYARTISMCKNTFPAFLSDGKSLYYAIDFPDAEIRVIALNTTDGNADSSQSEFYISDKQKEWIKNKALNTKYSVIVLGHAPLEGTQNVMVHNAVSGGSDVMGYLREFKNNGGTLIGCFWGHNHSQVSEVVDGILHVSFGYRDTAEFLIVDQNAKTITTVGFGVENRNFQF